MRIMVNVVEQMQSSVMVVASTEIGTIQGVWKYELTLDVDSYFL